MEMVKSVVKGSTSAVVTIANKLRSKLRRHPFAIPSNLTRMGLSTLVNNQTSSLLPGVSYRTLRYGCFLEGHLRLWAFPIPKHDNFDHLYNTFMSFGKPTYKEGLYSILKEYVNNKVCLILAIVRVNTLLADPGVHCQPSGVRDIVQLLEGAYLDDSFKFECFLCPNRKAPPPRPGVPSVRPLPQPTGLALNLHPVPPNTVQYSAGTRGTLVPPPPPMQMNYAQHTYMRNRPPLPMHPSISVNPHSIPVPPHGPQFTSLAPRPYAPLPMSQHVMPMIQAAPFSHGMLPPPPPPPPPPPEEVMRSKMSAVEEANIVKRDEQLKQVIWDSHTGSIGGTATQAMSQNANGQDQKYADSNGLEPAGPLPRPGVPSVRPLPPPPGLGPPLLPEEPEPKRQRLDDSLLIPEDQFMAEHPSEGENCWRDPASGKQTETEWKGWFPEE